MRRPIGPTAVAWELRYRCRVGFGFFFFSSRRRHTRLVSDWSSDVCSSDLTVKSVTEKPQLVALAGTMTRPAVLTGVHTAFTDGDLVGALHSGAACDKLARSEERRVGKEGRSRWSPYH